MVLALPVWSLTFWLRCFLEAPKSKSQAEEPNQAKASSSNLLGLKYASLKSQVDYVEEGEIRVPIKKLSVYPIRGVISQGE